MVDHLIAFATAHYLLVGAFVILLALLIAHELSRGGRSLSTSELTALVNKDEAVVVDIRPAKDYAAGHIVGALNIPQDKLMARLGHNDRWYVAMIWLIACAFGADWAGLHFMVGAFLAGVVMDAEWFDQKALDFLL